MINSPPYQGGVPVPKRERMVQGEVVLIITMSL